MKQTLAITITLALMLSACATDPPNAEVRSVSGAVAGAAVGAVAGASMGNVAMGAGIGAIAGLGIGAAVPGKVFQGRQYYRDSRGYCYYIGRKGKPRYNLKVKC